ncbi:T9SS type A sorting domain-containing protein [Lewinella sp. IMCC34191]|uniref:T9SS type A sorting domain-containing protein n=1 Tax=Lewinella sp. IMCC34191 TaxID=2259172 RepID=UPI000E27EFDC|nr:T9SS type A sorting domain-containing protein [Lewinella sp. IMCC34191]
MKNKWKHCGALLLWLLVIVSAQAQSSPAQSVAREWNEVYLDAIRNDLARPVVHARNLYHSAAAMYDAWALINGGSSTALMGRVRSGHRLRIDPNLIPDFEDKHSATEEAISYAAYRLLLHRYADAPGVKLIDREAGQLMIELNYDTAFVSTDYANDGPAALGNHIAAEIIAYGMVDGANEEGLYENDNYPDPANPPLDLENPFSILQLEDPNRWQPLAFGGEVIDQSGNVLDGNIPGFLGATWGKVDPFAIPASAKTNSTEDLPTPAGSPVYHDPGPPAKFDPADTTQLNFYRWNFELVLKWSSHLDPTDNVMWDISPGARGNLPDFLPSTPAEYRAFYKEHAGGQPGNGRSLNPITGEPYAPNIVPRGDYTRVLAEFWADGPASETPPGHWFTIFNKVMDHPLFERKLFGKGEALPALEYDVKAYLALGGAMHDAAITAWSIKGKYDYIRPISAIRHLAVSGQASVPEHRFYNPTGIRLDPGYIELVDSSAEVVNTTLGMTVKARAWIGNTFIDDPDLEQAGVDWINPTAWEPYQRPTFVTPNFAGYISGHSTFSAAAATVLESLTGSPFFPGGIGEFVAEKNDFLVFEEGPSQDIVLQWATYHDAAAETSLSRIWGGIHPPIDDIPGRRIGRVVGRDAIALANKLFQGGLSAVDDTFSKQRIFVYPNPVRSGDNITLEFSHGEIGRDRVQIFDSVGRTIRTIDVTGRKVPISTAGFPSGVYFIRTTKGRAIGKLSVTP